MNKGIVMLCALIFMNNDMCAYQKSEKEQIQAQMKTIAALFSLGGGIICLSHINGDIIKSIQDFISYDSALRNNVLALISAVGFFALAKILWPGAVDQTHETDDKPTGWQSDQDKENWAHPTFPYMVHVPKPTVKPEAPSQNSTTSVSSEPVPANHAVQSSDEDYPTHIYQLVFLES